jgi:hypothetical protein
MFNNTMFNNTIVLLDGIMMVAVITTISPGIYYGISPGIYEDLLFRHPIFAR